MNLQKQKKKIAMALATGLALGTMFAVPVTVPIAEAASESVLKLKSAAETFATQGEKLLNEGKFEEAGEAFRNAAKEDEKNDGYWFQAGMAFYKAEKFNSAGECFKKAVKLKPDEGIYNKWFGVVSWQQYFNPGTTSSGTFIERAEKYLGRAAELMPNDVEVHLMAGQLQEKLGISLRKSRNNPFTFIFPGSIEKHFKKAYQYYRRVLEIDPNNPENVAQYNRFANAYPEYGFQPYGSTPQSTNPATGASGTRPPLNTSDSLGKDGEELKKLIEKGKTKAYNAGSNFEWWDEVSKADFEALPFADEIEEAASHVYRVTWRDDEPDYDIEFVVLVPRHVRIVYGPGEEDVRDSLLIVEIASKYYDERGIIQITPSTSMNDKYYIKKGETQEIFHWSGDESFSWQWLEEGKREIEQQKSSAMVVPGAPTIYTFEDSGDPNVIILRGQRDEETWTGKMEVVPGVTTVIPPYNGE